MRTYDLIVIGAGVAGVAAATKCAWQGWGVAIIDGLPYGGTCVLRGCDPKKILRRGAEMGPGGQRPAHPARLGEVHRRVGVKPKNLAVVIENEVRRVIDQSLPDASDLKGRRGTGEFVRQWNEGQNRRQGRGCP